MYIVRGLFVIISVILSCLIWERLWVTIRQDGYEEIILQSHMSDAVVGAIHKKRIDQSDTDALYSENRTYEAILSL